jgi:hypothetical protein
MSAMPVDTTSGLCDSEDAFSITKGLVTSPDPILMNGTSMSFKKSTDTWDRYYDFLNIYAEEFGKKNWRF